jgi:hypothetical protein
MNFAHLADELQRQEFARLVGAVTPRIEAFRSMTPGGFRDEVAAMMERLDHTLITVSPWLVTLKAGRKYVTACANPADPTPIKVPAIRRLHEQVCAASAFKGIYVTPCSFTPDAEHYATHAPIDLVDGSLLIKSMQRSRKGVLLPQTYKVACRQCGEIVQHSLAEDEPLPCRGGHMVPPSISRAALIPYGSPTPAPGQQLAGPVPTLASGMCLAPHPGGTIIKPRNMSLKAQRRRAIKAHNQRLRGRSIKEQQADSSGR